MEETPLWGRLVSLQRAEPDEGRRRHGLRSCTCCAFGKRTHRLIGGPRLAGLNGEDFLVLFLAIKCKQASKKKTAL